MADGTYLWPPRRPGATLRPTARLPLDKGCLSVGRQGHRERALCSGHSGHPQPKKKVEREKDSGCAEDFVGSLLVQGRDWEAHGILKREKWHRGSGDNEMTCLSGHWPGLRSPCLVGLSRYVLGRCRGAGERTEEVDTTFLLHASFLSFEGIVTEVTE